VFNVDAALAVARTEGMFAARGLDLDIKVTPNSTEQMRGLGAGSWQIASTAFDNVLGWSGRERAEIVAVAQVAQGMSYRFMFGRRLAHGKISGESHWRWMRWTRPMHWSCAAYCWRMVWRWSVAIMC
jgi:hypothetical protein